MKLLLHEIPEEGIDLRGELPAEPYDLPTTEGEKWKPLHYAFHVQKLGDECLITGELRAPLSLTCVRCLEPFDYEILVPAFQQSLEITGSDSADLTPLIREDIVLGLPLAPCCERLTGRKCSYPGKSADLEDAGFADLRRQDIWGALEKYKDKD